MRELTALIMKHYPEVAVTYEYYQRANFLGHILPAIPLWGFAWWWTINVIRQHFSALATDGTPYETRFYYASTLIGLFPLESAIRIVAPVLIMVNEIRNGFRNGTLINIALTQHMTMYAAFLLNGVLEVFHYRRTLKNRNQTKATALPSAILVSMSTTAFLFTFHQHGEESRMDSIVHQLLILTIVIIIACILMETWCNEWVTCAMVRVIAAQTFATWLMQICFTMYPDPMGLKKWHQNDPDVLQLILVVYFLHWIGNFCLAFAMAVIIRMFSHSKPTTATASDIV